jgi:hypothetical protein
MAFAFSMIAATFKFLVSALAGDLMAIGIELAGLRLNVCLISKQKKSYNLSEFFLYFLMGREHSAANLISYLIQEQVPLISVWLISWGCKF